jgi:Protein phosphatase 2C/FHA domain
MVTTDPTRARLRVTGATVQGASHKRSGVPNQDACAWLPKSGAGDVVVAAVADGHGSPKSFRSQVGADLAVNVATTVLWRRLADLSLGRSGDGDARFRDGLVEITERWSAEVRRHLGETPFDAEELDRLAERGGEAGLREVERNALLAYGATLLVVAVGQTSIHYAQIGDGDILVVSADGRVRRPLPGDRRLIANETTSLCDKDAARLFRTASEALDRSVGLVLLMSDGYGNSFPTDEEFQQVGSDLLYMIDRDGIDGVEDHLEDWLTETTEHGAGDDVTLAIVTLPRPARTVDHTMPVPPPPVPRSVSVAAPQRPPAPPSPQTRPLIVELDGRRYDVTGRPVVVIGRGQDADVRTANRYVSGRHALLRFEGDDWVLYDANSRSGTFHQGMRVHRMPVTESTSVWLGDRQHGEPLGLLLDGRPVTTPAPGYAAPAVGSRTSTMAVVGVVAVLAVFAVAWLILRGGGGEEPTETTAPQGGPVACGTSADRWALRKVIPASGEPATLGRLLGGKDGVESEQQAAAIVTKTERPGFLVQAGKRWFAFGQNEGEQVTQPDCTLPTGSRISAFDPGQPLTPTTAGPVGSQPPSSQPPRSGQPASTGTTSPPE